MILPHFQFRLTRGDSALGICEVVVGPTPHQELAVNAVFGVLGKYRQDDWNVRFTRAPYRSW